MTNEELIAKLQRYPKDMPVVVFDVFKSAHHGDDDLSGGIGIHQKFDIYTLKNSNPDRKHKKFIAISFDNEDYETE